MIKKTYLLLAAAGMALSATSASAQTCVGNCGTAAPNGVVTAPPAFGPNYQYVSTFGGVVGAGRITGVTNTANATGSQFTTAAFSANAGDALNFFFNYVTSDGSGDFTDYSFAELLSGGNHVAWLFTARTTPTGNTSPGFGLPSNDSTLTPNSTAIVPGAPVWAQLGTDSNRCFDTGCGYTGWIGSAYTIANGGSYQLRFGVTNVGDANFASGLAFAGVTINNVPVNGVPEPMTWAMMIAGFGLMGAAFRRQSKVKVAYAA